MITRSASLSLSGSSPKLIHPDGIGILDELLRGVPSLTFREGKSTIRGVWFPSESHSFVEPFIQSSGCSQRSRVDEPIFRHQHMVVVVEPFSNPHSWNIQLVQLSVVFGMGPSKHQLSESTDLAVILPLMDNFPGGSSVGPEVLTVVNP